MSDERVTKPGMQNRSRFSWQCARLIAIVVFVTLSSGCLFILDRLVCRDVVFTLRVQGVLVDEASGTAIAGTQVGGRTITNGEVIEEMLPRPDGAIATDQNGEFVIVFSDFGAVCNVPGHMDDDFLLRTDHIEVIVLRDGCETTYVIEVNEETVVDLSFPNDTLELRDPILVPPCESEGDSAP